MIMTLGQIEDALYKLVKNSPLPAAVNGGLYKRGYRPAKSSKEDIVVSVKMGTANQIQRGTALITVFVPWITIADGTDGRNISRCNAIEIALQQFISGLPATASERNIRLSQSYAIGTDEDEDVNHSRVVAELDYSIFTEE
jgi:hypothetical protein